MTVARKLAVPAVLAALLALALFTSTTAKAAPGLGQARLTSYTTAKQPAAPATFNRCTTGSSHGNITTCFTVYHTGRYVEVMRLTACDHHAEREVFLAILGPHNQVLAEDPTLPGVWITPGTCTAITYHPFHTVPAGTYCGYTYRASGDHGYLIGKVCAKL
jgi:hypothetical protein